MVSFLIFVLHEAFKIWDFILIVLVIGVFYEGWKGASATSINDSGLLFACMALLSSFISTASAAVGGAAGQFHQTSGEVNLQVVLLKPGHA